MSSTTHPRRRHRHAHAGTCRTPHDLHAVRQPHHVAVRCGDRYAAPPGAHAPRGSGGAHGRRLGTADRRARHRHGHRRSRPRQRRRRIDDRARPGIAAGPAVRPHRDDPARPRRISGTAPGRGGGADGEGVVDRDCQRRRSAPMWRKRSASRVPAGPARCISACRPICSTRRSPPATSPGRSRRIRRRPSR